MAQHGTAPILKGIVHGMTIELEKESGFPDGKKVFVLLCSEEEDKNDQEAAETLQTLYHMRHLGRSIVKP